jgi:hypothetical protein
MVTTVPGVGNSTAARSPKATVSLIARDENGMDIF